MLPPRVLLLPVLLAIVFLSCPATAGTGCRCRKKADIFFLLDMSGSLGDNEFERMRKFTAEIVKRLCIKRRRGRVAIASFAEGFKRELDLTGDKEKVLKTIKDLVFTGGSRTNMGPALKKVREMIIEQARKRVPTILVVMTDGFPYDVHSMKVEGRNNHIHGIVTFALGFGKAAKYLLAFIASKPLHRYRKKVQATDLDKLALQIQVMRRICPKKGPGYCLVTGDPHIKQIDGMSFVDNGLCTYTLVKTCPDTVNPSFNIEMSNRMCGRGTPQAPVTCAKSITIYIYGTEIRMLSNGKVFVNGKLVVLPYIKTLHSGEFIDIVMVGTKPTMYTDFGLRVQYKGSNVYITVPRTYRRKVCGLCGNYNRKKWDDAILRNGTQLEIPRPRTKRNRNLVFKEVVESWLVPKIGHTHEQCVSPGLTPMNCSSMAHHKARGLCAPLKDRNGVFGQCVRGIDKSMVDDLFDDCVYDVCEGTNKCAELDSFANICRLKGYKITHIRWREELDCPLKCGANAKYLEKMTSCPATCAEPKPPTSCPVEDQEGCQCKADYIREGDDCIHKDQCGCVDSGNTYHKLGDRWLTANCDFEKTCGSGGAISEVPHSCGKSQQCVDVGGGVRACVPP